MLIFKDIPWEGCAPTRAFGIIGSALGVTPCRKTEISERAAGLDVRTNYSDAEAPSAKANARALFWCGNTQSPPHKTIELRKTYASYNADFAETIPEIINFIFTRGVSFFSTPHQSKCVTLKETRKTLLGNTTLLSYLSLLGLIHFYLE